MVPPRLAKHRRPHGSFSGRVLAKAEQCAGLVQRISGQFDVTTQDDVYWCRVTMEVSTTDIDWLSSEFHDLLATKTTGVALAAVRSLEDTEINGIVGWQLLEGPSARPPAAEGFGPRRMGNTPCAGLEDHGTPAAFPSGESDKKEFQRGRKAKPHDDVEANCLAAT